MELSKTRRAIMTILGGTLIGILLFVFSLSINNRVLIITNYIIALFLFLCSLLAAYHQYKESKLYIYIYIFIILIVIVLLCTYVTIFKCL